MSIHLRSTAPQVATVDHEARTVECIASTFADVVRPGYIERLDPQGADLARFIGAPVLDAHRSGSTRDQLGVVEAAEIRREGGRSLLWCRLRFRSNEAARAVLADIGDGTLRGLSIGYSVAKWKDERQGDQRIRTAITWTLIELSVVPVPADAGAHFRNEAVMETETQTTATDSPPPVTMSRADMNREIRSMARRAGLPDDWANTQIDNEVTLDAAREAAFDAMEDRQTQTRTTSRATIRFDNTDPAVIAERAGEAVFARSHPSHTLSSEARQYAGLTFPELARDCLRRAGVSTTALSSQTVITRALHTTGDFPAILGNAVNRELRRGYDAPVSGARLLARQTTARDFRPKSAVMLGEGPELEKVPESAEYKRGTIDESAERYSIATFGKVFAVTRQLLVNDDVGAFASIPQKLGQSALAFEAAELVRKIEDNPNMSDGIAVFATGRGNDSTGASDGGTADGILAGILAELDKGRTAMRRKTGLSGAVIEVSPKFVLVPPELETAAQKALAQIQAAASENVNPFSILTLVVEPRLTDPDSWFMVADPATVDGLEYAYLEGEPGVQIETRAGFDVDGMEVKVRLDFGAGWIDHRGWHRVTRQE